MMFRPSLKEAQAFAEDYAQVPVSLEIREDTDTTIGLLEKLGKRADCCFLLESVEGGEKWGRYSFLGFGPAVSISARRGVATTVAADGKKTESGDPVGALRSILAGGAPRLSYLPRFTGGAVGFFGYDCIRLFEDIPDNNTDDAGFPDFCIMVADRLIAYDNIRQKLILIANMDTKGDVCRNYAAACKTLKNMELDVRKAGAEPLPAVGKKSAGVQSWKSNVTKDEFEEMVGRAKKHINDGDIFQVVLSRRYEAEMEESLLNTYRVLRSLNPSPYMYYLRFGKMEMAGASPETLVRLEDKALETCPIAGSRPRGKTEDSDEELARELLGNEKELSEHNMLVDLARNDLGRVSRFGSVKVKDYKRLARYSHIMHITTTVTSRLSPEFDALDVLGAMLPAGTLSGAPKVMAMKLIERYENRRRGPYGGAVGYIGFDGDMDVCITIRTIVKNGIKAYVQAGAGIVADSVPENEYRETENKAKAVLLAAETAGNIG